MDIKYHFVNH